MARITDYNLHIHRDKYTCIFCKEEISQGAFWNVQENEDIIVGHCCKNNLIKLYKDIILDELGGSLKEFEKSIQNVTREIISKEIEIEEIKIRDLEQKTEYRKQQNKENMEYFNVGVILPPKKQRNNLSIKEKDRLIMEIAVQIVGLRREILKEKSKKKIKVIENKIEELLKKQKEIENR